MQKKVQNCNKKKVIEKVGLRLLKGAKLQKKRLLKKWCGAGARLLKRCKVEKKVQNCNKKRLLKKWFGAGARLLGPNE